MYGLSRKTAQGNTNREKQVENGSAIETKVSESAAYRDRNRPRPGTHNTGLVENGKLLLCESTVGLFFSRGPLNCIELD